MLKNYIDPRLSEATCRLGPTNSILVCEANIYIAPLQRHRRRLVQNIGGSARSGQSAMIDDIIGVSGATYI